MGSVSISQKYKFDRVYIEISNICNLQCDFCPEVERKQKIMTREMFTNIIRQLRGLTKEVTFHLMGEPLLHPQFADFVQICVEENMPINLTTNGTLLKYKEKRSILLDPIIRQINFSLQSWTANFKEASLGDYLAPIFAFTKVAMIERPDLYVNYRLWNMGSAEDTYLHNAHFIAPIEREFDVKINRTVDVGFKKSKNILGRLYLNFDSRFVWPNLNDPVRSEVGFCYALKNHFGIHADGTVVPCCLDKEAQLNLGNADAVSVLSALNSERARRIRHAFDEKKIVEPLCQRCGFIERFDSKLKVDLGGKKT